MTAPYPMHIYQVHGLRTVGQAKELSEGELFLRTTIEISSCGYKSSEWPLGID